MSDKKTPRAPKYAAKCGFSGVGFFPLNCIC